MMQTRLNVWASARRVEKTPTTPDDFSRGVIDGLTAVLHEHEVLPAAVRDVVHGSTVATNAILERRGARTGDRLTGVIFVAFGIKLALSRAP